jgi:hypothetical protein
MAKAALIGLVLVLFLLGAKIVYADDLPDAPSPQARTER